MEMGIWHPGVAAEKVLTFGSNPSPLAVRVRSYPRGAWEVAQVHTHAKSVVAFMWLTNLSDVCSAQMCSGALEGMMVTCVWCVGFRCYGLRATPLRAYALAG